MIDLSSILLGCGLGLFAGLVPGLGPFTTLLLAFPLLLDLSIIQLLIVYSALITVSIYVGSVPATLYGIPGDSASMPVVFESIALLPTAVLECPVVLASNALEPTAVLFEAVVF